MRYETNPEFRWGASVERGSQPQSERGAGLLTLAAAVGVGAGAMYLLDPARGRRRRHLVGDKVVHMANVAGAAVTKTTRDVANRTRGLGSVARRRLAGDDADDVVVAGRVRAELGRAVSHPGAIDVAVHQGDVTVSGPVIAHEADRLIDQVRRVRGVRNVEDQLDRHERPDRISALQGKAEAPPASRFELLQENWTPAARLLTTATGGALAVIALGDEDRRNPLTAALGLAGLALLVRGATNMPFDRLIGAGARRGAVPVRKSINIAAPVDDVFGFLTDWEHWPEWMSHVREVRASGPRGAEGERTHWVVDGPAGTSVEWDAVTTRLARPEIVAWKTVEGSPIVHTGQLRFVPTADGVTRVDVRMSYNPIAGAAGHAVATLLGRDPKHQLNDDLARLKMTIETGRPPHDAAARTAARAAASPRTATERGQEPSP